MGSHLFGWGGTGLFPTHTLISRTVFWPATTGNIIMVNATSSTRKPGTQIDPSITHSDSVYSASPCSAVIHTRRWKPIKKMAQKQALFTHSFWCGRWLPWVTAGWNQLYKLFKRPSSLFTGAHEASELPRYLALFFFMFPHQTFSFFSNFSVLSARVEMWGIWDVIAETSIAPSRLFPSPYD